MNIIEKLKIKSIKNRLSLSYFISSSFLLIFLCIILYFQIKSTILESFDRLLHSKLQILTANIIEEKGELEFELAELKSGEYTIKNSGHYYKVIIDKNIIISPSLGKKEFYFEEIEKSYVDKELNETYYSSYDPINQEIRVLKKTLQIKNKKITIFLAETLKETNLLIKRLTSIFYIIIPLGIFIIEFLGIKIAEKGLKPLEILSEKIKNISHENLNEKLSLDKKSEELDNIVDSFNEMLKKIENAFETEKFILSEASHYLKTPITAIKTNCDVILKKNREKDEYIEVIKKIRLISNKINQLINDMLSQAKLDSEGLNINTFSNINLTECITNAILFSESLALNKNITVNFQNNNNNIFFYCNYEKITELFSNIIENGIKYNNKNGYININLSEKDKLIIIEFNDNGLGINKEDLDKVFNRFYRSRSINIEGTGLGLSIAKKIVEIHNGQIEVESELGKGTSFKIIFSKNSEK